MEAPLEDLVSYTEKSKYKYTVTRQRVHGKRVKAARGWGRLAKFVAPTPMCQIWIPNEFTPPAAGKILVKIRKVEPMGHSGLPGRPIGTCLNSER